MNRLFLVPGYLEDSFLFDILRPWLPPAAEVLALVLAPEFAQGRPAGAANVVSPAQHYRIGPTDVLIGYLMGGWIVAHLKAQTGAMASVLSGFTNQRKTVAASRHPLALALYAWLGVGGSRWLRQRAKRQYEFDESRELYARLADRLVRYPRRYVHRQLQVLFALVPPLATPPYLRLHARRDNVIRPPDEAFVEIPGDHFAHYYYPQLVAAAIERVLG